MYHEYSLHKNGFYWLLNLNSTLWQLIKCYTFGIAYYLTKPKLGEEFSLFYSHRQSKH